jgi:FkbM family methyltransferase
MDDFKHEYNLGKAVQIIPKKRHFKMLVTPRYVGHYHENIYEEFTADLVSNITKDGMCFIDVGAHYGFYSLLIGSSNKNSKIIAFEPVPESFSLLVKNVELNELKNIQVYNLAVSDRDETKIFNITEASDSAGFYQHPLTSTLKTIEVRTLALDDFLADIAGLPIVIKIDTEGHELHVLEGMRRIIKEAEDIRLVVEFNPSCVTSGGSPPESLLDKIRHLGFEIFFIDDQRRQAYKLGENHVGSWRDLVGDKIYVNLLCVKKQKSLSVCLFSHSSQLSGGAERSLLELTSELISNHGAVCSVVLPSDGPLRQALENVGASTIAINYSWWCDPSLPTSEEINSRLNNSFKVLIGQAERELGKLNPDVVFTNTMVIPWGAITAHLLGKPHVWFIHEFGRLDHSLKFFLPFQQILKTIRNSSNLILTNSKAVRKALFGEVDDKNIATVYYHIDIPSVALHQKEERWYFGGVNATKLIISGNITETKGQEDAILAVKELLRRKKNVVLVIMGTALPWYLGELERIVGNENLGEYVRFHEFNENPYLVVNDADIVLVCSKNEAFGRVTLEAMLLKKAVIGTNSGGTAELIREGYNGLLYEPGDYRQLADKIEYLIEHREKIREFGENGFEFANTTFTKEKYGGEVHKRLTELRGVANLSSSPFFSFVTKHLLNLQATADAQIAQKEEQLTAERDRLVISVGELESERQRLVQRVGELEADLQQVEQLTSQQVKDLNKQLNHEREQTLIEHTRLQDLVAEHGQHIATIEDSLAWRLIEKYRRVKQQIFPIGTMRRRAYDSVLKSFKKSRPIKNIPVDLGARDAESVVQSFLYTIPEVPNPIPVKRHQANVDIIVCVHNALEDTKRCLEAVVCCSTAPYSLILVDDGSTQEASEYLCDFASSHGASLIKNEVAKGYTFAANQGMRQSKADYVVLLNSDTIVSSDWLDRMVACIESDRRIGIVGPLSNSASWQSIPEIVNHKGDDWAMNSLPQGMDLSDMGLLVAKYSGCLYPRIPFLNGFCLMIKRQLIDEVGYFDETNFGKGYGEENDYCLRSFKAGWQLAVADDVYIYHAQSRSYTEDRRRQLYKHAEAALALKHDQTLIDAGVAECQFGRVLEGIRARSRVLAKRKQLVERGRLQWDGRRLLILLPVSGPGGGANVIIQEAQAMREMGIEVKILNLSENRAAFDSWYADARIPFLYAENENRVPEFFQDFDAVVGTFYVSINWMHSPQPGTMLPIRGYYIQDFEPNFFPKGTREFKEAWDSYTRYPDLVRITKTAWNRGVVKEQIGVDCSVVGPSVDLNLYRPRRRQHTDWPKRPLRVAAMIRPSSHHRNAQLTMEVLREISRRHGDTTEIIIFGCRPDDPGFPALPQDFLFRNRGILNRRQLAFLFNEVDIFVDFSGWQAMGLSAMEAMACGAAVIVPTNGGADSFARHEENSLMIDTGSHNVCLSTLERLIKDHDLRRHIQTKAIFSICEFFPERAAYSLLHALFNSGSRSLLPAG